MLLSYCFQSPVTGRQDVSRCISKDLSCILWVFSYLCVTLYPAEILFSILSLGSFPSSAAGKVVQEVCAARPQSPRAFSEDHTLSDRWDGDPEISFPTWPWLQLQENGRKEVVSCYRSRSPSWLVLRWCGRKHFINSALKSCTCTRWQGLKSRGAPSLFGPDFLVQLLIAKRTVNPCHGTVAADRYRAHPDPELDCGSYVSMLSWHVWRAGFRDSGRIFPLFY